MAQQVRGLKTSRLIVETAAQVFCERGYEGTSTTEILSRCHVTRGALYFHFASKQDLALAVLTEGSDVLLPSRRRLVLQSLIDFSLEHAYRLQTDVVTRASVRLRTELEYQGAVLPEGGDVREVILGLLREAEEAGEIVPSADPGEVADVLVGSCASVSLFRVGQESGLTRRVATLWRYLLPAVAVPGLLMSLQLVLDQAERRLRERLAGMPAGGRGEEATEPPADGPQEARPGWARPATLIG
ncbi:TetR/AcrR family transcriptional regulator [Streptomyces sp. BHT-5-2]|uniref:ScbR family autoregulator-binding transcription factor n=1 Tax=unclassified Streptomyces TaxID=2593676 RepID=UPI001C8D718D|nr:ScbR family autoregulator-binding transcription factor [Streptomyces sp. BHT-5-2]QZL03641.1 TetR/AcrR family transcriptional regulator [Streptomyces sp. BHT-5-2]